MQTLEEMRARHRATARYTVYLSPPLKSCADRRSAANYIDIATGLPWSEASAMSDELNRTMRKPGDFGGPVYGVRLEAPQALVG